ncbi:MAG TPA: PEGA domain-containing protein [Myxococcaceae bacterium]|nr:PEGA domain-containing protein [Myxococcaceae bacterium]
MNARRSSLLVLIALIPLAAPAQTDDLLTPLTPSRDSGKKIHRKPRQRGREDRDDDSDSTEATLGKAKGRLLVRGSQLPPRAVVLLDGQEVKPDVAVEVEVGRHSVVVRRPGFREFSSQAAVTAGRATEIAPVLPPVAGVLSVTTDLPGIQVLVDGNRIGDAPVQDAMLPPGDHEVILRRDGFEDRVSRLSVSAGRDYTVSGSLKPKLVAARGEKVRLTPPNSAEPQGPLTSSGVHELAAPEPWYGRWYVWAGVGAAVAAGVTSAIVVSQNGAAHPLDPNRDVCGGACAATINPPGVRMGF